LVREKALEVTMKHIHYEDENSRYIAIGCVEKVKQHHFRYAGINKVFSFSLEFIKTVMLCIF